MKVPLINNINMNILDTLEDICLEVEKIPNKNPELENKLKNTFNYILELRKLEITRTGLINL